MNTIVLILRLFHVVGGAFWVGTAIFNRFFLVPAVAATGQAGQQVLGHLTTNGKLVPRINGAAYLTVLSGAGLYWIDSQGFTSAWQSSGPGVGFALGAIAALLGFGFGQVAGRNASRLGKLAAQIQGSPTAEQAAAIDTARRSMNRGSAISAAFLIAALALMATARYWVSF